MNDVVSLEVTELLEKITSLESKLDAMDVKFEEIATEARKKLPGELRIPESQVPPTKSEFDEKITALESKLDAMDAKVEVIASEAKANSETALSAPRTIQANTDPGYDLAEWLPSQEKLKLTFKLRSAPILKLMNGLCRGIRLRPSRAQILVKAH